MRTQPPAQVYWAFSEPPSALPAQAEACSSFTEGTPGARNGDRLASVRGRAAGRAGSCVNTAFPTPGPGAGLEGGRSPGAAPGKQVGRQRGHWQPGASEQEWGNGGRHQQRQENFRDGPEGLPGRQQDRGGRSFTDCRDHFTDCTLRPSDVGARLRQGEASGSSPPAPELLQVKVT